MAKTTARYTATTISATAVTLTPKAGREDADNGGNPRLFGTGTIVVTVAAVPDPTFWQLAATGVEYLVEFTRV